MKITYLDPKKEDWFLVSWTLSNKCNYKCSYCPDILHNGTTGHPEWEVVSNFVENFRVDGKNLCYRLSGGEPTYWKHFIDLAKLIKSKGHTFSFLTNGSQTIKYYSEISRYTDGIIISYHDEFASLSHIIDVVKSVECPVFINLMLVPDNFKSLYEIAKEIYSSSDNVNVWPKVILDKSDTIISNVEVGYSKEQKDLIENWPFFKSVNDQQLHRGEILLDDSPITGNDLIMNDLNRFKGWKCWAGLHMINIDMWGDIYRADCQQGGPIGNLREYKLATEPITCQADRCACLSDIYLRKEK